MVLGTLRTNVDARLETRSKLAGMFASQVGKDIMELIVDINKLRDEIAVRYSTFCLIIYVSILIIVPMMVEF